MSFSSRRKRSFNSPPANRLRVASQQPRPVCTWSAHAPQSGPSPSPFPRNRHTLTATATAAGELFIFGGYVRGRASSDLYVFSTRDFSTTILQTSGEIPGTRIGHGAALIGTSTLLICGGETNLYDKNVLNHDSLYLLNLVSQEWIHVVLNGPGPKGRTYHTANVVGSKLFVFGGQIGGNVFNDMWTLDLNSLKSQPVWESYEPTPGNGKPLPRTGHVSVSTEDRIIIFGGSDSQYYYNDTWSFDISTQKWAELQCTGSIPSRRRGHAAVLVDDVMYVFGGSTGKTELDDFYALQLSTQRWFNFHNVGPSPHRRAYHAMASDGTRVFVLGGNSKGARADEISLIHVFDTKDIKYPDSERNDVNPNEKTTQLARKSSAGPPTQVQPQHPAPSSPKTPASFLQLLVQAATPAATGHPASPQITHRNPGLNGRPSQPTGVNSKPGPVLEDDVSEGSTEYPWDVANMSKSTNTQPSPTLPGTSQQNALLCLIDSVSPASSLSSASGAPQKVPAPPSPPDRTGHSAPVGSNILASINNKSQGHLQVFLEQLMEGNTRTNVPDTTHQRLSLPTGPSSCHEPELVAPQTTSTEAIQGPVPAGQSKFAAPHSSPEGEVARLEVERQMSLLLAAQTERDQRIARLTDELALKSALLEKAETNAAEGEKRAEMELREHADRLLVQTSLVERRDAELADMQARLRDMQTRPDELLLSRDQQVRQHEKELANMRAKLEANESELEAVRLRLTDAEKSLTKSKAEADTLRAQTAKGFVNRDEDPVTRRLMERMRALEVGVASKWNEKSIEEMECSNEG